jgi:hypothetical protein
VTVQFLNKRQQAVRLVWLDETGKHRERAVVQGASRWLVKTFAGHAWMILDENGKLLGHIVTPEKPARIIIQ